MYMTLPRFTQSLGGCSLALLSRWGDAPSLRSVAGGMLPRFAQSLGGCSLASLSHWGDTPSLRSVAGGCSLTLFGRFIYRGPIKYFHQIVKWLSTPNSCTTDSFSPWPMLATALWKRCCMETGLAQVLLLTDSG